MSLNRRKIEINGNKYEVLGDKPWIIVNVTTGPAPGQIIVDEATTKFHDFLKFPQKYNALRRIGASSATLPVLFSGDRGFAMAEEIAYILNQKL